MTITVKNIEGRTVDIITREPKNDECGTWAEYAGTHYQIEKDREGRAFIELPCDKRVYLEEREAVLR